jgi:hypothetical protein
MNGSMSSVVAAVRESADAGPDGRTSSDNAIARIQKQEEHCR